MTAIKLLKKGFTLVELLIVIAILAIIAVVVIAAINPGEMLARTRDTGLKTDVREVTEAISRYYTVDGRYPWQVISSEAYPSDIVSFGYISPASQTTGAYVGICKCTSGGNGTTACTSTRCGSENPGELITKEQLKNTYLTRSWARTTAAGIDQIYIGKDTGAGASVVGCFIPKSRSVRETECNAGNVYTILNTAGKRTPQTVASCGPDTDVDAIDWVPDLGAGAPGINQLYVCIP